MNDHEDPSLDADFGDDFRDPAYDELRGLLAAARVESPVPADVAARLDATLADLTADRRTATSVVGDDLADDLADNVVVPLRRRSRLAPRLLVAAAVVVLVGAGGVGVNQVLQNSSVSGDSATTNADAGSAPAASADAPEMAPQAPSENTAGKALTDKSLDRDLGSTAALSMRLRFSSAQFESQVDGLLAPVSGATSYLDGSDDQGRMPAAQDQPTPTTPTPLARTSNGLNQLNNELNSYVAKSCPGPADPDGEVFTILLDKKLAALVVGPLTEGSRLVRAWSCDGSVVLAAASVDR